MKTNHCGRCGEEVRHGTRGGFTGWLHREDKDHRATLGRVLTETDERRDRRLAELRGQDPDYVEPLPPVEVYAHDVDPADFAPRSGIRQVINLILKQGWDLVSVKHARGPYVGSGGKALSISDTHVVKARGPAALDGGVPVVVASWRDGKFDFSYIGTIQGGRLIPTKVDATTMKNWIKGIEPSP